MTRHNVTHIAETAEGNCEDQREPELRRQTSTMPILNLTANRAETGTIPLVNTQPEGAEPGNDEQDAPRHTDETVPSRSTQEARAAEENAENGAEPGAKPGVLIIEDTLELAEVIQATLESMDIESTHESNGSKGLARLRNMHPDLLLLDIGLPDMTGWKVLESLREQKNNGEAVTIPTVIVITAYGDPANRLIGKLQGIHSYLIKPFTADEVEQAVTKALGTHNSG